MTSRVRLVRGVLVPMLVVCSTHVAHGQLPSASTRALGMGDSHTAAARGYAAVAWNPALLALPGNPRISVAVMPVRGVTGLDPVTLSDLSQWQGRSVPWEVREQWLRAVETAGAERGTSGADASYFAAQVGRFGVQLASTVRAAGQLSPGAAELLFFGNAGRTGEPRALELSGSTIRAHAATTLGASYALPIAAATTHSMAVGVTVKYTIGHLLLIGADRGSMITADPTLSLRFPVVGTSTNHVDGNGGSGFGVDIGFAVRRGPLTAGANLRNVISTFEWEPAKLRFREGLAQFDEATAATAIPETDYAFAPVELRQAVADARFGPLLAIGAALEASSALTLAADARARLGSTALDESTAFHIGGGAEYRIRDWLPLRLGGALISNGFQAGGGFGIEFGPVGLGASLMRRTAELGTDTIVMLTLLSTSSL